MMILAERSRVVATLSLLALVVLPPARAGEAPRAAVAADHALASACGAELLEEGGNAVDAAVATALCAGVVQPAGSGLGGGGFAVIAGSGAVGARVFDFREVAPASAGRDMYRGADGRLETGASQTGARAVAVPAESRGLAALLSALGSLTPRQVAAPAIRLAQGGFPVGKHLAGALADAEGEVLAEFDVDGRPAREGDLLRRKALAATLRRWAATGGEDLHVGRGARTIVAHVQAEGGALTAQDLADYAVRQREAVMVRWGDRTVITMPPPSSGGVALAQVLRTLEGVDLAALGWNSAAYLHRLTEAMKHAYADRAHHLGDPDFVEVPVSRLLSDERIALIRDDFDAARTFPAAHYAPEVAAAPDAGTQHISVLDASGLAVALTTTINTSFGAERVPPGVGVVLNDEMDDFSLAPGVPNAYGLVGTEANAIASGKRPLSSMTPTIVLGPDGAVELVVGASGGSTIISSTLQVLLSVLVFERSPAEAVAAPRIHHQWTPDVLVVEPGLDAEVVAALRELGHTIRVAPAFSAVQAVQGGAEGVRAGADPRKGGAPAMVP